MVKKVSSTAVLALCAVVVVVVLLGGATVTEAVTCNAVELSPCASAITSSQQPSATCCNKLREQRPCLCGYLRDPNLRQYVNSPGAKRVATSCGVSTPSC